MTVEEFVQRITSTNRAWKVACQDSDPYIHNVLAKHLQEQKSAWQVELYRSHSNTVWFKPDLDKHPAGDIYSVRFAGESILSSDGDIKWNAEHIPKDLLSQLLTKAEYLHATQPKK